MSTPSRSDGSPSSAPQRKTGTRSPCGRSAANATSPPMSPPERVPHWRPPRRSCTGCDWSWTRSATPRRRSTWPSGRMPPTPSVRTRATCGTRTGRSPRLDANSPGSMRRSSAGTPRSTCSTRPTRSCGPRSSGGPPLVCSSSSRPVTSSKDTTDLLSEAGRWLQRFRAQTTQWLDVAIPLGPASGELSSLTIWVDQILGHRLQRRTDEALARVADVVAGPEKAISEPEGVKDGLHTELAQRLEIRDQVLDRVEVGQRRRGRA